jgi:mRNA-degrading endonuclease RelE of RelBE toxin-antitoxin system
MCIMIILTLTNKYIKNNFFSYTKGLTIKSYLFKINISDYRIFKFLNTYELIILFCLIFHRKTLSLFYKFLFFFFCRYNS